MNSLFNKIITGGGDRPTRFHDEEGNPVTPGGYLYALNSLITTILYRSIGYRPPIPWISFRARRYISHLMRPTWTILEFGSGMSTPWFAKRCHKVFSIEHNPKWYGIVKERLSKNKFSNVFYSLRDIETYPDLSEFSDGIFDFVLIDGIRRTDCVRNVISKIKPGGWIYLDNTDMSDKSTQGKDFQQAEQLLLTIFSPRECSVIYFTDFVPTNFFAKQGMLVNFGQNNFHINR